MTDKDWRILKEDYNIFIRSKDAPNPLRNWNESGLPLILLQRLEE